MSVSKDVARASGVLPVGNRGTESMSSGLGDISRQISRSRYNPQPLVCRIAGCGRKTIAHGLCWGHYGRWRRGQPLDPYPLSGKPKKVSPPKPHRATYAERFWESFTPEPNTGCWLWLGEYTSAGYGRLGGTYQPWGSYAHRFSWLLAHGEELPRGGAFHVRHSCDTPACVNPDHLTLGTAAKNMLDRSVRGRAARLLNPEQVQEIRRALRVGESGLSLAKRFGVTPCAVYAIKHGQTWRWLEVSP